MINSSLGVGDNAFTSAEACDAFAPAMTTAAANLWNAGISNFVSSGNDGFCAGISFPSCLSQVNSVGSVYDASVGAPGFCVSASSCLTTVDIASCPSGKAFFETATSANQVAAYSNSSPLLTLFASSDDATTTEPSGNYTSNFGGTSAASPYAAGAAAVLQSAAMEKMGRYLTPQEVHDYFVDNGVLINDSKAGVTKPRIDLAAAVAALPNFNVPDLVVAPQFSGDHFVLPSTEISLSSNVANVTLTASTASIVRLYLSSDATISNTDTQLLTQNVSALSGQTNTTLPTWSVNVPASSGVYYYGFCVDVVQDEEVVDNNCSVAVSITVNDTGSNPDLDLVINSQSATDFFVTPSQALTFNSMVRNDGLATSPITAVRLFRSLDATIGIDDVFIQSQPLAALDPETNSAALIFNDTAPAINGVYYYGFCVDTVDNESNENNNCGTAITIEVNDSGEEPFADLLLTAVSLDDLFVTPGQLLSLTSQVRNAGLDNAGNSIVRLLQSDDSIIDFNDTELSIQSLPPLAMQTDSAVFNWIVTAPSEEGQYYYGFCVDTVSTEQNVANNCSDAFDLLVNSTGQAPDDELCFPIKARDGNVVLICL